MGRKRKTADEAEAASVAEAEGGPEALDRELAGVMQQAITESAVAELVEACLGPSTAAEVKLRILGAAAAHKGGIPHNRLEEYCLGAINRDAQRALLCRVLLTYAASKA